MEFSETIKQVQTNWKPYKKWEFEQQKKEKQNEELRKKYPPTPEELKHAKQYGRTIVDVINTMDQHSIDKSEDVGVALDYFLFPITIAAQFGEYCLGSIIGKKIERSKFGPRLKNLKPFWGAIGVMVLNAVIFPPIKIIQSKITKQASRIARFQTRENDLKDSRNFVVYSDEQIKEAEKITKTMPEIKENRQDKFTKDNFNPIKSYKQAKNTFDSLKKDEFNYEQWRIEYLKKEEQKMESFKTLTISKEELSKAEKDRDIILNTVKKVENNALEYYNNMEMALYLVNRVVSVSSLALGTGLAGLTALAVEKSTILKNNKIANILKTIPIVLSVIVDLIIMAPSNKLIKDAARIGRFKAKQELLKDPQNFIAYDDEQKKIVNIEDVPKAKHKGLLARFKDDLKAIKQLQKDAKDYKNYMDTEHKEELKIQEALKQIKISDKQEQDAKNLQKQSFNSFEKMDEKAQRFTDDTDAAVDSVRIISVTVIGLVARLASVLVSGKIITKANDGKVPKGLWKAIKVVFTKKFPFKGVLGLLIPYFVPPLVIVPMTIKGVQIKKDAGKIGVMSAMKDLEDPKNFLKNS